MTYYMNEAEEKALNEIDFEVFEIIFAETVDTQKESV